MATLVFFHAHPDDEAIATGGTMHRAVQDGHRVVLVVATRGEHGEVPDGFLHPDEELAARRVAEVHLAAEIIGTHRVEFLPYRDSGMMGEPTNEHEGSFWTAPVHDAADHLVRLLREENADVLTMYDENGGYGHPDHIQVHRVGHRAAELVPGLRLFEATMNRDRIREMMSEADRDDGPDVETLGSPDAVITTAVDVSGVLDVKRRAMAAHASQIPPDSWFMQLGPEAFLAAFGTEWFIRKDAVVVDREPWLL
ncbi:MAG: PIG-L family deacetylase [Acidimicrobiia bacterium]|nr:PIG-L family deacetylase [Acidimicrobiia bacterium]NNF68939.1 GlcNAc-PI de-N-acetylase [Acidimicrobiia bacterium]